MKYPIFYIAIIYLVLIFSGQKVQAQYSETAFSVKLAFKAGNAEKLAQYFNNVIELNILENNNIYSKKQAERILTNFFSANHPLNYENRSERISLNSGILIGILTTKESIFQITCVMSEINGTVYINKVEIERSN